MAHKLGVPLSARLAELIIEKMLNRLLPLLAPPDIKLSGNAWTAGRFLQPFRKVIPAWKQVAAASGGSKVAVEPTVPLAPGLGAPHDWHAYKRGTKPRPERRPLYPLEA